MLEVRQPVLYQWEGAIPLRSIPTDVLYGVRLRFVHDRGVDAVKLLRASLRALGPTSVLRLPFLGAWLRVADPRNPFTLRLRDGVVTARLQKRTKGRALSRLIEAIGGLPGARDLTIRGESPHFDPAYSDIRPCTTCAARSYPPSRRQ